MRWCPSFLVFCFLAVVHALSSSGSRLLVVLEDAAQKDLYSTFWGDLEGTVSSGWLRALLICHSTRI
jgi:oligosaccharyltransferase complex subunit beta